MLEHVDVCAPLKKCERLSSCLNFLPRRVAPAALWSKRRNGKGGGFHVLTGELEQKIKATIRSNLTARHVPARVVVVEDIPYTRSGKKVKHPRILACGNV